MSPADFCAELDDEDASLVRVAEIGNVVCDLLITIFSESLRIYSRCF